MFAVNDILVARWGHGMILVTFYKVVNTVGKSTVIVKEIDKLRQPHGDSGMEFYTTPIDREVGVPLKRIFRNGKIKIDDSRFAAVLWDGKPCYENTAN